MIIFSADDGAFRDVEIDDDLAPALAIGTDIMLTPRYGFFVEAKKAFLRTQARGTFDGAPVVGDVRLGPWAASVGGVFSLHTRRSIERKGVVEGKREAGQVNHGGRRM